MSIFPISSISNPDRSLRGVSGGVAGATVTRGKVLLTRGLASAYGIGVVGSVCFSAFLELVGWSESESIVPDLELHFALCLELEATTASGGVLIGERREDGFCILCLTASSTLFASYNEFDCQPLLGSNMKLSRVGQQTTCSTREQHNKQRLQLTLM